MEAFTQELGLSGTQKEKVHFVFLGLDLQGKVQFARAKLSKYPTSKAIPCYILTFSP